MALRSGMLFVPLSPGAQSSKPEKEITGLLSVSSQSPPFRNEYSIRSKGIQVNDFLHFSSFISFLIKSVLAFTGCPVSFVKMVCQFSLKVAFTAKQKKPAADGHLQLKSGAVPCWARSAHIRWRCPAGCRTRCRYPLSHEAHRALPPAPAVSLMPCLAQQGLLPVSTVSGTEFSTLFWAS